MAGRGGTPRETGVWLQAAIEIARDRRTEPFISPTARLFALAGMGIADINTSNSATDYHSGQVFHIDVTAAWHLLPIGKGALGAGANGFYLQQTTGDSGSGALLGSFKTMMAGVGPVISYAAQFSKIGLAVAVKWLPQIATTNTLDGDYLWAKLAVTF